MRLRLEVLSGPMDGHIFQFNHATEVGREAKIGLPADRFCSRRHALIDVQGHRVFLEDLSSTNGTYVDEQRLNGRTELSNGQVFRVGKTWLEIGW